MNEETMEKFVETYTQLVDTLLKDARKQQQCIDMLKQRIIELQGHDNLSYIDRKLEGEL